MNKHVLGRKLINQVKMFMGTTNGQWCDMGQNAYMTADFPNIGQATMFAQYAIWDNQVQATVIGGNWDDRYESAMVVIKPGLSAR